MSSERVIKTVQVDGLVLMKIIKHCQDELVQNQDFVSGVLLGLSNNDVLEVTHSFQIPRLSEDTESDPAAVNSFLSTYQTQMMKSLRSVNVDYLYIGLYQNSYSGAYLNRITLENLYSYYRDVNESIVLVYDPSRAARGEICLRAFQFTANTRNIIAKYYSDDNDRALETDSELKTLTVDITDILTEIPVTIRNSHLINALIGTIESKIPKTENSFASLDLGVGVNIEKQIKTMSESVDNLCQQLVAHVQYLKLMNRGANKDLIRQPVIPSRLDTTLSIAEIMQSSQDIMELVGQTLAKIHVAEALHPSSKSSSQYDMLTDPNVWE